MGYVHSDIPVAKLLLIVDKGYFDVDLVGEITWGSAAFDQLVLPHDYKQTIRAFVDAQMSGLDEFDDVIKGKGKRRHGLKRQ
jgi:hypothetical protein